jgi:hypothetical protein
MPRDGALVELQERAGTPTSDFVPRPRHFTASMGASNTDVEDCVPGRRAFNARWISFRDRRRLFYAIVALGKDATPAVRRQALSLLDSLRFDPSFRPSWQQPAG